MRAVGRALGAKGSGGRAARRALATLTLVVVSGCASHAAPGNRFIHEGEPVARYGPVAPVAHPPALSESVRRARELQSRATAKPSLLPTIEARDPALRAALLQLAGAETAGNHRLVAAAYVNIGIPDYAYKHLRLALRLDPCDARAYEGLARLERGWGQPDLALGDVYRALACDARSPAIYNTLGTVLHALGQEENATKAFESALPNRSRGRIRAEQSLLPVAPGRQGCGRRDFLRTGACAGSGEHGRVEQSGAHIRNTGRRGSRGEAPDEQQQHGKRALQRRRPAPVTWQICGSGAGLRSG